MLLAAATGPIRFEDLHLDPVLLHIHLFGRDLFDIKWYSIAYIGGILIGWWYLLKLLRQPGAPMSRLHADDMVFYATIGIIAGGRFGYALFYAPWMFVHPLQLLRLWDGGMSFHGGALGTMIGIILLARKHGLSALRIHDYVACCAPFGLFFGRLANFVNGELWGKPSDAPWAIVFPHAGPFARHPSQLYEAGLEGILLFTILAIAFWRTKARYEPGRLLGIFLTGYGCFRYFVEFFREPDDQFAGTFFQTPGLHMGQLLDLPMILAGLYLVATAKSRRQRVEPIAGSASVA